MCYFLFLDKRYLAYKRKSISRDLIRKELGQDLNNYALRFNDINEGKVVLNSFGLHQNILFSNLFPRFRKCLGADLFDFLDAWLMSVSKHKNMSYSISSGPEFLQYKLTRMQSMRVITCVRNLIFDDIENIDIFLLFQKNKVILECVNIRKKEFELSNRVIIRI